MAAGQLGQHAVADFTTPQNNTTNDAVEVLGNFNTLAAAQTAHDADASVHVPSGLYAARPAPGSGQNKYYATDRRRLYVDTGAAWVEPVYALVGAVNVQDPAYGATGDGVTDDSVAIQAAIDTGLPVFFPPGTYLCHGLTQSTNGQLFFGLGGFGAILKKNANGTILASTGNNVTCQHLQFRGDASTPTYTGDNVTFSGTDCAMRNCGSRWAYGRAVKATGHHFQIVGGTSDVYQTADATATGYDIEIGVSGTATLYHTIDGVASTQSTGGILATDVGSLKIQGSQFGKLTIASGTAPFGVNGGVTIGCRILGAVTVGLSSAVFVGNQFGASADIDFLAGTSGCRLDKSNTFSGSTVVNNGNANNLIEREISTGSYTTIKYGGDSSVAVVQIEPVAGTWAFPGNVNFANGKAIAFYDNAAALRNVLSLSSANNLTLTNATTGNIQITVASGSRIQWMENATERVSVGASDLRLGGSGGPLIQWGAGSPQSVVSAPVGSQFHRTDGGTGTAFYIKETGGSGSTGWVAK